MLDNSATEMHRGKDEEHDMKFITKLIEASVVLAIVMQIRPVPDALWVGR